MYKFIPKKYVRFECRKNLFLRLMVVKTSITFQIIVSGHEERSDFSKESIQWGGTGPSLQPDDPRSFLHRFTWHWEVPEPQVRVVFFVYLLEKSSRLLLQFEFQTKHKVILLELKTGHFPCLLISMSFQPIFQFLRDYSSCNSAKISEIHRN